jgi:hypothetical protein
MNEDLLKRNQQDSHLGSHDQVLLLTQDDQNVEKLSFSVAGHLFWLSGLCWNISPKRADFDITEL